MKVIHNVTKRNLNQVIFDDGTVLTEVNSKFVSDQPAAPAPTKPELLPAVVSLALAYKTPRLQR